MLPKVEPQLSNAIVKNFEQFQDDFNTSTDMEFVEKAIRETIMNSMKLLKACLRKLHTLGVARCVNKRAHTRLSSRDTFRGSTPQALKIVWKDIKV